MGRQLLDEYIIEKVLNSHEEALTLLAAALLERKIEAVGTRQELCIAYSSLFGKSEQDYYVRGSDNFKVARRKHKPQPGWAAAIWQQKPQVQTIRCSRACYNMAIIGEINGNLEGLRMGTKAYENMLTNTLHYVKILERKMDNAILKNRQQKKIIMVCVIILNHKRYIATNA